MKGLEPTLISFVSPLPQLGFSCSSETLVLWLLPFLPVYLPRVLAFRQERSMLGALMGRVVEWAVHRTASQVTAYSQLCDQGHLRNVGTILYS